MRLTCNLSRSNQKVRKQSRSNVGFVFDAAVIEYWRCQPLRDLNGKGNFDNNYSED